MDVKASPFSFPFLLSQRMGNIGGFCLWPTKVIIPSTNTAYNYSVQFSSYPNDILKLFVDTLGEAGIGFGFYYSLTNNFYLNEWHHIVQNTTLLPGQMPVTQKEYEDVAIVAFSLFSLSFFSFGQGPEMLCAI